LSSSLTTARGLQEGNRLEDLGACALAEGMAANGIVREVDLVSASAFLLCMLL
jgi:hypothetical protein